MYDIKHAEDAFVRKKIGHSIIGIDKELMV